MTITTTAATLVVKLCGLFSSEHDGERAAAAAKADAIIREHDLTWADVLRPPRPHDVMVRVCTAHYDIFSEWERGFLRGIAGRQELSEKQRAVLERLHAKVPR